MKNEMVQNEQLENENAHENMKRTKKNGKKTKMKNNTEKHEKTTIHNEKGSRKNVLWQFPTSILRAKEEQLAKTRKNKNEKDSRTKTPLTMDNFQGKGRKHNQHKNENTTKKNPKGFEKKLFLIIFKEKEGKITKTIRKRNQMKRNEKGSRTKILVAIPKTIFEAKEKQWKCQREEKQDKKNEIT